MGGLLMHALAAAGETLYPRARGPDGDAGPMGVSYETLASSGRRLHEEPSRPAHRADMRSIMAAAFLEGAGR
jgi:hypothetical protein